MKQIRTAIFCVFFTVLLSVCLCMGVSAEKTTLNETVNLINANKNQTGDGYYWHNPSDTLTLTNLSVDTADKYGLRVPDGATIVLEGDSTVKASYCALGIEGNVTVKGNGTLTLLSDEYGILCSSHDMNKKLSFYSGTVKITSKSDGIHSESAWVSQNKDASLSIYVSNNEAYAVNARLLKLLGGVFEADSPLNAADLKISSLSLKIYSDRPALVGTKSLSISGVNMTVGEDEASLAKAEEYAGENCVRMTKKFIYKETSLFFGESVKGYWDFVAIALAICVVAAVLLTPYIKHRKSIEETEAAKAAARLEEKENRRRINEEAKKQAQAVFDAESQPSDGAGERETTDEADR